MIVCPNCNHHNPGGASQCEACYTPLPEMVACPSCEAPVQADANFCGQCGFDIKAAQGLPPTALEAVFTGNSPTMALLGLGTVGMAGGSAPEAEIAIDPLASLSSRPRGPRSSGPGIPADPDATNPDFPDPGLLAPGLLDPGLLDPGFPDPGFPETGDLAGQSPLPGAAPTQLQSVTGRLLHVRSNVLVDLPLGLSVIHIGKANERVPPDIDLSGFQDSEIVSRIHADIRVEGDAYYLEDVGSANGTFVNNLPLPRGNRHRLRVGDRLSFGKGDLVAFLFQLG